MRLRGTIFALAALAATLDQARAQSPPPLTLAETLESVERSYPLLLAVLRDIDVAEAQTLAAQGAFDLRLGSALGSSRPHFYDTTRWDAFVSQPLRESGGEVYGGYKLGRGNFPPWGGDKLTLSAGEWRGGVRLPLLRDRQVDRRRTDLAIAELAVEVAGAGVDTARLRIFRAATVAYWRWVGAGRDRELARQLLRVAEERVRQLEESVNAGQTPPIEIVENRRAVFERQSQLVAAQRALENTAIEMSLYLRDANGDPILPPEERLPSFPEPAPLSPDLVRDEMARALLRRPEIQFILARRRQESVEMQWARNQQKPGVDVLAEYSRDFGEGPISKRGNEVEAALVFDLPLQRRRARGREAEQAAKIARLDAELQFARDRVAADVRDAASALEAAFARLQVVRQELAAARELEEAERVRFDLGEGTLFLVNLRELAAFDAALREVAALAAYHAARADFDAAVAALL